METLPDELHPMSSTTTTPPRLNKFGRRVKGRYINQTPLETISDKSDIKEAQDILEDKFRRDLADISHYMHERKVTIVDLLESELYYEDS